MKIELKNLEVNEKFSEETIMFMADVWIEGKKVAHAHNDGRGAQTYFNVYGGKNTKEFDENNKLVDLAINYCETLPNETFTFESNGETRTIEVQSTLLNKIDQLVEKHINEKEDKRFEAQLKRDMKKYVCYTRDLSEVKSYGIVGAKKKNNFSLEQMSRNPQIKEAVLEHIKSLQEKGYRVLNQNLSQFSFFSIVKTRLKVGLRLALVKGGFSKKAYTPPYIKNDTKKKGCQEIFSIVKTRFKVGLRPKTQVTP